MRQLYSFSIFVVSVFLSISCYAQSLSMRHGHFYDDANFFTTDATQEEIDLAEYYNGMFKEYEDKGFYRGVLWITNEVNLPIQKGDKAISQYEQVYNLDAKSHYGSILIIVNPEQKQLQFVTTGVIDKKRSRDPEFFAAPVQKFSQADEIKMNMVLTFIGMLHLYITGEYP